MFGEKTLQSILLRLSDRDLEINLAEPYVRRFCFLESANYVCSTRLAFCTGEDSTELDNHMDQVKYKVQWVGMNPHSKVAISMVVSFFKGKLGQWASTRDKCIHDLKIMLTNWLNFFR
jgi:hypothetical protein